MLNSKKAYQALAIALFLLLLLLSMSTFSEVSSSAVNQSNLAKELESKMSVLTSQLDQTRAIQAAENSSAFNQLAMQFQVSEPVVTSPFSFDYAGNVVWKNVTVSFQAGNSSGAIGEILVTLTPALDEVLSVQDIQSTESYSYTENSTVVSGWQFQGNAAGNAPIYETIASWTVPYASPPSNGCFFLRCSIGVWDGISDSASATDVAQAGTESQVECYLSGSAGCSWTYNAWTQFYPQQSNAHTCMQVKPGDSVEFDVYSDILNGGSKTSFDIDVFDFTQGTGSACTVRQYSFPGLSNPVWGLYNLERTDIGGGQHARVPIFNQFSVTGSILIGDTMYGINYPYSNGWWNQYDMWNSGVHNVNLGTVSSTGSFTQAYLSSLNT